MPSRLKLTAVAAALIVLVSALGAAFASAARVAPRRVGAAPTLPAGTASLGALAPNTQIPVDVTLNPSDPSALAAYATAVSTPGGPDFHDYLSVTQFRQRFAPSDSEIAAVESSLTAAGLSPEPVSANGLSIKVTATAAQLGAAFDTSIEQVRLPGGRTAFANTSAPEISGSVAGVVQGVVGLDDLVTQTSTLVRPHRTPSSTTGPRAASTRVNPHAATPGVTARASAAPTSCANAAAVATYWDQGETDTPGYSAYTAPQVASLYGLNSYWNKGDYGSGQTIGLVEFEQYSTADINAFEQCYYAQNATNVTETTIGTGATGSATGSGESELDIDQILGLAPAANVNVYEAPNNSTGAYNMYSAMVQNTSLKVISDSWASCEPGDASSPSYYNSINTLFQEAATEGQSVFVSSGDDGSTACYPNYTTGNAATTPAVNFPSSSPWITSVGGTYLTANDTLSQQTVWNESSRTGGATGGGVSTYFTMPGYQSGAPAALNVINANSSKSACSSTTSYCREVPDVSGLADPYTGYVVYYSPETAADPTENGWTTVGGTSASAPLWAAITALENASTACAGNAIGFANPLLYDLAGSTKYATDFTDIGAGGTNDYTPSGYTGSLYPTGTGYDMATGLGTPNVASLGPDMCALATTPSTVTVSTGTPAIAADGTATTPVTVTVSDLAGNGITGQAPAISLSSTDTGQTISALTDNNNGTYSATLTSSKTPGVATITATDDGVSGTTSLTQANLEIQELRFVGPSGAAHDGYVELYNESGVSVPLTGWSLKYAETGGGTQTVSLSTATVPAYGHVLVGDSGYASDLKSAGAPAADVTFTSSATPLGVALFSAGETASIDAVGFSTAPAGYVSGTGLSLPSTYPTGQFAWTRGYASGQPVNTANNAADFRFVSATNVGTASYGSPLAGVPAPLSTASPVNENAFLQSALVSSTAGANGSPNTVYTSGTPGTLDVNRTLINCSGITTANAGSYPAGCVNAARNTAAVQVTAIQFRVTGLTTGVLLAENSTVNTPASGITVQPLTLEAPAGATAGLNAVWSGTSDISGGLAPGATLNVDFRFSVVGTGSYSFAYNTEDDLVPYTGPLPADPIAGGGDTGPTVSGTTPTATTNTTPTTDTTPASGTATPVTSGTGETVVTGTITPAGTTGTVTSTAKPTPVTAVAHPVLTRLSLVYRAGHLMLKLTGSVRGAVAPGTTLTVRSGLLRHAAKVRVSARGTFTLLAPVTRAATAGRHLVTVSRGTRILARGYVRIH